MPELQASAKRHARNPLLLPKLARMINVYLFTRDSCRLATTCKALFHALMPQLWRVVGGVEKILRLIPGATVTHQGVGDSRKIIMTFFKSTLTESWERYWIYAPFVKFLFMYGGPTAHRAVQGWEILFVKHKEFGGDLLPNLEVLYISPNRSGGVPLDPIVQSAWLMLFLSRSVKKLKLQDHSFRKHDQHALSESNHDLNSGRSIFEVPSLSALLLVNILAKMLPDSEKTVLQPYYNYPTEDMIELSNSQADRGFLNWFKDFPAPTNLTRLYIYSCAISGGSGEALIVIGHLPCLETLEIDGDFGPLNDPHLFFEEEPLPIPLGLFPRLKTPNIVSVPGTQLFYHVWSSEAMVFKLSNAYIDFSNPNTTDDSPFTRSELEAQIIPHLYANSPNLIRLTMFALLDVRETSNRISFESEIMFELLSHLPLLTLQLWIFGEPPIEPDYDHYHLSTFPRLISLILPNPQSPSQLRFLAKLLPNLLYLSIALCTEAFEHLNEIDLEPEELISQQPIIIQVRKKLALYTAGSAHG